MVRAHGRLFRTVGRHVRPLANVRTLDLPAGRALQVQLIGHLLALEDARRLVVLRQDGSLFASTQLPRTHHTLVSASRTAAPTGTEVAFAAMRPDHRIETRIVERGVETVYLLRPDTRTAVALHREHMQFNVCGHAATLSWNGSWLLYGANEGDSVLIDTRRGRTIRLSSVVRRPPGLKADDSGSFGLPWG